MLPFQHASLFQYHKTIFLKTLKQTTQSTNCYDVYLESRAEINLTAFLPETYKISLQKIYNKVSPLQKCNQIIVITSLNEESLSQINERSEYFDCIHLISLSISNKQIGLLLSKHLFRKKIRSLKELPLDFNLHVDQLYSINQIKGIRIDSCEGISTFLTSLSQFGAFQFHFKTDSERIAKDIQSKLISKLQILSRHNFQNYKQVNAPLTNVLILNRNIDYLSPLLYSYYYGSAVQQLKLNTRRKNSAQENKLFIMDMQKCAQFLQHLSLQKAKNQKTSIDMANMIEAKKIISKHFDPNTEPIQISTHTLRLKSVLSFLEKQIKTAILQQNIVHGCTTSRQKMQGGTTISSVQKWVLEEKGITAHQFNKMAMLASMCNSFYFFQRGAFKGAIEQDRQRILHFLKKQQGKHKYLKQSKENKQSLPLFRHRPSIIDIVDRWLKEEDDTYNKIKINQKIKSKYKTKIIYMNGPLGYNEAVLLLKHLKEQLKDKCQFFQIICDELVTTDQYMSYLLQHKC